MSRVQTVYVAEGEGDQRLDRWFKRRYPQISQGMIEKICRKGECAPSETMRHPTGDSSGSETPREAPSTPTPTQWTPAPRRTAPWLFGGCSPPVARG